MSSIVGLKAKRVNLFDKKGEIILNIKINVKFLLMNTFYNDKFNVPLGMGIHVVVLVVLVVEFVVPSVEELVPISGSFVDGIVGDDVTVVASVELVDGKPGEFV